MHTLLKNKTDLWRIRDCTKKRQINIQLSMELLKLLEIVEENYNENRTTIIELLMLQLLKSTFKDFEEKLRSWEEREVKRRTILVKLQLSGQKDIANQIIRGEISELMYAHILDEKNESINTSAPTLKQEIQISEHGYANINGQYIYVGTAADELDDLPKNWQERFKLIHYQAL